MDLLREYAAGAGFPTELRYLCFFQIEHTIYGLAAQRKQILKYHGGTIEQTWLARDYRKIVPDLTGCEFFAYMQMNPGSEVNIYRLDKYFKEFDSFILRKADRSCHLSDICFDGLQEYLFLVYSETILKYNCNGDFLGSFLSAPPDTTYCTMCTYKEYVYVAYKKKGSLYIAKYTNDGRYKERTILGNEYEVCGMQVVQDEECLFLRLYLTKNKAIPLFIELNLRETPQLDSINIKIIKDETISEATCHIRPGNHTCRPVT